MILPYTQNWKSGNMCLLWNSDNSCKSRFKNYKNINWAKNWKVPIWYKRKNIKFPRFPSFWFCPIPQIENSKISEILFILNFDTGVTQGLKAAKKWTETKTIKVQIWFRTKSKIFKISEFLILPYIQLKSKTRKSTKVLFYLTVYNLVLLH